MNLMRFFGLRSNQMDIYISTHAIVEMGVKCNEIFFNHFKVKPPEVRPPGIRFISMDEIRNSLMLPDELDDEKQLVNVFPNIQDLIFFDGPYYQDEFYNLTPL